MVSKVTCKKILTDSSTDDDSFEGGSVQSPPVASIYDEEASVSVYPSDDDPVEGGSIQSPGASIYDEEAGVCTPNYENHSADDVNGFVGYNNSNPDEEENGENDVATYRFDYDDDIGQDNGVVSYGNGIPFEATLPWVFGNRPAEARVTGVIHSLEIRYH
jgi:hypothetical protein